MSYESYDPRVPIREQIGTERYDPKRRKTVYEISINNDYGRAVKIPFLLTEEIEDNPPEQPYIEMLEIITTYDEHNPSATIREMRFTGQCNFYFTSIDGITTYDFLKAVKDKLLDITRTNQTSTTGTWYFSIRNGKYEKNEHSKQVEHVYMFELHAIYTDRE